MAEELTVAQQRFIAERMSGCNIKEAASRAGVTQQTASRWLKQVSVQAALTQEATYVKESARAVIERYYTDALESSCQVVISVASNELSPAAARLNAAKMIQDRLAPVVTGEEQDNSTQPRGVDFSIFTQEELSVIQPIFLAAEERQRGAQEKINPMIRRES